MKTSLTSPKERNNTQSSLSKRIIKIILSKIDE
jgi:hypothetical protein